MECILKLEDPTSKLTLNGPYSEILNSLKGIPYKVVIENQYLVLSKVKSLGGVRHNLGLHFSNHRLIAMELFFFDLVHIDTDDEFEFVQEQMVKIYGKPTTSALQDGRFKQNQWIFENQFEITNNQTEERGHALRFQIYSGSTLMKDGRYQPRS